MENYLQFFEQFIRNPREVGAVLPSSPSLAESITGSITLPQADVVVEIGPGSGAFTGYILSQLKRNAVFFALDINEKMCGHLRQRFPGANVYCDSVTNLGQYLEMHGVEKADCIISSLPWAAFKSELQEELLQSIAGVLSDQGEFATFAYLQGALLPSGKKFRKKLETTFGSVERTPVVWKNFPPAFVYRCIKGRNRHGGE